MVITHPVSVIHCCELFIFLMRVSKVITKTGDGGQTGLSDGSRVSKSSLRIHALGQVDHLNSVIGWTLVVAGDEWTSSLQSIQQDLFNMGGELSMPNSELNLLKVDRVDWLNDEVEKFNQSLEPLKEFILPGGTEFSARIHMARTVCRTVERYLVALQEKESINEIHIPYLNRLSDYLFVLARVDMSKKNNPEIQWQR